jgi:hypothetical protein
MADRIPLEEKRVADEPFNDYPLGLDASGNCDCHWDGPRSRRFVALERVGTWTNQRRMQGKLHEFYEVAQRDRLMAFKSKA